MYANKPTNILPKILLSYNFVCNPVKKAEISNVKAEIITIGDEILIGQITDTNSAWIAQRLNEIGVNICQITSIPDNKKHIYNALNDAQTRADLILITGGLGPTRDDITKEALCEYFNTTLRFDNETYKRIESYFNTRGFPMLEVNRKQAEVPEICTLIQNEYGTAPGMWFEKNEKVYISMPGVPYEMKAMMKKTLLDKIKKHFNPPVIIHKTILTQGIGESFLAEKINDWECNLPANVKLAYLPSPGIVRLRVSANGDNKKELSELVSDQVKNLERLIKEYIYGYDTDTMEEIIGRLLRNHNKTISIAESCTGGYIAHLITGISGSSDYFKGGVITYSNEIKMNMLGVSKESLEKYGAVSESVVKQMAGGVKQKFNTDYAIATSGIAGPSGGTKEKPVGTVWIALATPAGIIAKKNVFGNNRERNIRRSALASLNMLRKELLNINS